MTTSANRPDDDKTPSQNTAPEPTFTESDFVLDTSDDLVRSEEATPDEAAGTAADDNLRDFEDLSLAELLGLFTREPSATWRSFLDVVTAKPIHRQVRVTAAPAAAANNGDADNGGLELSGVDFIRQAATASTLRIGLYLLAIIVALTGNIILHSVANAQRSESIELASGLPLLFGAMLIWLVAEVVGRWSNLKQWFVQITGGANDTSSHPNRQVDDSNINRTARKDNHLAMMHRLRESSLLRPALVVAGLLLSTITWFGTSDNSFTTLTFYIWLASIACWTLALFPAGFDAGEWATGWVDRLRRFRWRNYRAVIFALCLVMVFATAFRVANLESHPREMTDDHVEKILDSGLVRDGARPIFFANNGGREPFQMYAIAIASYFPGLGINHFTLKVVAVIESLLTIPVMFWMGYELVNMQNRRLRLLTGLLLAALVAVSYWHVAVTRLALRIILTPLITGLLFIYLARGIRRNTRADFLKVGVILGFGLYMYQAVRMLPVVIVVAVILAILFRARDWTARLRYGFNLAALVLISFVTFLPMFHYSAQYPDLFWRRATGRLLGDSVIEEELEDGTIVMRDASVEERLAAFQENLPVLTNNIRNTFLMFNWKGDVATINGVPNEPTMDIWTGALLIVGVGAWLALMFRRPDTVHWLIPGAIFILLLPSALSIAFPVENPSHTRTSGALPLVYLLTAFPLAVVIDTLLNALSDWRGKAASVVLCGVFCIGSYAQNTHLYFDVYPDIYTASFDPYSAPGQVLEGFASSDGSFGNAFMIGYPHWWSHRAIGLAAGLEERWPNGIVERTEIPIFLEDHANRTGKFRFDPNLDIIFFYSPEDTETGEYLRRIFPDGQAIEYSTYAKYDNFMLFRAPAIGQSEFESWIARHKN